MKSTTFKHFTVFRASVALPLLICVFYGTVFSNSGKTGSVSSPKNTVPYWKTEGLVAALNDSCERVRCLAVIYFNENRDSLLKIWESENLHIGKVVKLLNRHDFSTCFVTLEALAKMNEHAKDAIPVIASLLERSWP